MSAIEQHDHRSRRCPKLGHDLQFSYCRSPGSEIPCSKIYDCWWETFDIRAFMEQNYGAETLAKVTAPPKPKATSLIELIKQAQKRTKDSE